jgi:hypothetical protein
MELQRHYFSLVSKLKPKRKSTTETTQFILKTAARISPSIQPLKQQIRIAKTRPTMHRTQTSEWRHRNCSHHTTGLADYFLDQIEQLFFLLFLVGPLLAYSTCSR